MISEDFGEVFFGAMQVLLKHCFSIIINTINKSRNFSEEELSIHYTKNKDFC